MSKELIDKLKELVSNLPGEFPLERVSEYSTDYIQMLLTHLPHTLQILENLPGDRISQEDLFASCNEHLECVPQYLPRALNLIQQLTKQQYPTPAKLLENAQYLQNFITHYETAYQICKALKGTPPTPIELLKNSQYLDKSSLEAVSQYGPYVANCCWTLSGSRYSTHLTLINLLQNAKHLKQIFDDEGKNYYGNTFNKLKEPLPTPIELLENFQYLKEIKEYSEKVSYLNLSALELFKNAKHLEKISKYGPTASKILNILSYDESKDIKYIKDIFKFDNVRQKIAAYKKEASKIFEDIDGKIKEKLNFLLHIGNLETIVEDLEEGFEFFTPLNGAPARKIQLVAFIESKGIRENQTKISEIFNILGRKITQDDSIDLMLDYVLGKLPLLNLQKLQHLKNLTNERVENKSTKPQKLASESTQSENLSKQPFEETHRAPSEDKDLLCYIDIKQESLYDIIRFCFVDDYNCAQNILKFFAQMTGEILPLHNFWRYRIDKHMPETSEFMQSAFAQIVSNVYLREAAFGSTIITQDFILGHYKNYISPTLEKYKYEHFDEFHWTDKRIQKIFQLVKEFTGQRLLISEFARKIGWHSLDKALAIITGIKNCNFLNEGLKGLNFTNHISKEFFLENFLKIRDPGIFNTTEGQTIRMFLRGTETKLKKLLETIRDENKSGKINPLTTEFILHPDRENREEDRDHPGSTLDLYGLGRDSEKSKKFEDEIREFMTAPHHDDLFEASDEEDIPLSQEATSSLGETAFSDISNE